MEEEVKYCKNCKRDISATNYVIHTVHCERNIQLCDRCSELVPRSEREKHEEEFHSKDTCSECGTSVEKWQVEKHKATCVKKLVPCEYCELEVHLDNLSEHSAACGSRTEQCSKCKKHVMLKDLKEHPRYCSKEEREAVPCEHCGRQIDWNELMEHTAMCGTRTERCFLCNEHVMVIDRDTHLVTCEKLFSEKKSHETCGEKLVSCEYCELKVPLDNLYEHTSACSRKTKQCSKCNKHVMLKDLQGHPEYCSRREPEALSCDYCGLKKNRNELMEHTERCGTRTEKCFLCNEHVMLKDRDTHFVTCSKKRLSRTIPLKDHSDICGSQYQKCDKNIPLKNLETHVNVCEEKRLSRTPEFPCQYCGELYPSVLLKDHSEICGSQYRKCEKCDKYIPLNYLETHVNVCEEKRQLRRKVSSLCKYCGKYFSSTLLEDHVEICESQNQKCEKCDEYIPLKNMEIHLNTCKEKRLSRAAEFPCQYCGESYLGDFLEDHADKCGTRTQKCEKCDKYIALKNMETHSNVCKESMSKNYGDCQICHQSISWIEMNVHSAYCAQVNSDIHEYDFQNKFNELALRKESEALTDKTNDGKKFQLHEDKRCSFCFENFPYYLFARHLKVCQERPYNCDECLKAMPYRIKEEHEHRCPGGQKKIHVDDHMHQEEKADDNKGLKKLQKCQFCDLRLPDILLKSHLKECEHRGEECLACFENIPVKDMNDHKLRKCKFVRPAENKNFNYGDNTHAEAIPEPSKNFERWLYLEENAEICPSCKCKIPEERYHGHLLLCYNLETQCHFCGIKIPKKSEHFHFRNCFGILEILEDSNSSSKKKKGKINKGKSLTEAIGQLLPSWMTSNKDKSFERNNTKETYQESHSWQLNRGQNYERGSMAPVYPMIPRLNEVNELPCEFCNQMWPSELLIEHESGCRPDLVSFPKTNEDDQKFAAAAAATVSQISHTPVLSASPKIVRKDDTEWKVQSRSYQSSIREDIDCRKKERNVPQKQVNAKEKFFFYPSQDTDDSSKYQPGNFRKKRYPQTREGQELSKTKPDEEIGVKKDNLKKNQFTSFRFSASKNDEESQNGSNSRKENDEVLSTDVKNYDETKTSNSYDLQALSAESIPIVDYPSNFNREIRAVGAERTERKRIMHSRKDVDVNKDFEEISVQKSIIFDENNKSEPSKFLGTTESRTFNLSMPAIWNTESSLSSDKIPKSHFLKSFDNNYDNEAKDDALSNAVESFEHISVDSSKQVTDYDAKNSETFGSSFVESINNNQKEENENDTKSERSNSDETFYDADDGSAKYFDTVNVNFHGSSNTREEKLSPYDINNLNFSSRNKKVNVNPSSYEDLNADIRLEEEDSNQKDCDLDAYFQFLHENVKQSDEAAKRLIREVEKLSYRTAGDCKCGNKECCCKLSSLIQETSPQSCSFKDASCSKSLSEPMDTEPLVAEAMTSNQMKSKKSLELHSKSKVKDENIEIDEAMKWKKWRVLEKKLDFSSDSE